MNALGLALWLSPLLCAQSFPPKPPVREQARLDRASDVALDAARSLAFLESGQAYFEAYPKSKHTTEEDRAYLNFLSDYARELDTFKAELEALRAWSEKKSRLVPGAP